LPGDGPRQAHPVKYAGGFGHIDITLPPVAAGQVAWVQPVLTSSSGVAQWGPARPVDARAAITKQPCDLTFKLSGQKDRTTQLRPSKGVTVIEGKKCRVDALSPETTLLKVFSPDPKGALVKTGFSTPRVFYEKDGRKAQAPQRGAEFLQIIPPVFVVD